MLVQEKCDVVTSSWYEMCSYTEGVNKRTSISSIPQQEHALTWLLRNADRGAVRKNIVWFEVWK